MFRDKWPNFCLTRHLFPDDLGRIDDALDLAAEWPPNAAAETAADWLRTGRPLKVVRADRDSH